MGVARQVILALVLTATSASAFVPSTTSLSAVKPQRTASWTTVRRAEEEAAAADAPPAEEEAAPAPAPAPAPTKPYLETIYGVSKHPIFGGKPWDPLGLATIGTDGTLDFFRAAEVKHGRIAMAAFLGFAHHKAGIVFPGLLSVKQGISFADLGAVDPVKAWSMVPYEGVLQIFGFMAVIEWYAMTHKEGKWVGADAWFKGTGGVIDMNFDPLGFSGASPAAIEKAKMQELENGRLAMIGAISCAVACQIPGSVPLLSFN